jgi:hypothetical protein
VGIHCTATKRGGIDNTLKATAQDLITSFPFAQGDNKHQNRPEEKGNNTITKGVQKQNSCTRPATAKASQFSKDRNELHREQQACVGSEHQRRGAKICSGLSQMLATSTLRPCPVGLGFPVQPQHVPCRSVAYSLQQ